MESDRNHWTMEEQCEYKNRFLELHLKNLNDIEVTSSLLPAQSVTNMINLLLTWKGSALITLEEMLVLTKEMTH